MQYHCNPHNREKKHVTKKEKMNEKLTIWHYWTRSHYHCEVRAQRVSILTVFEDHVHTYGTYEINAGM
jgi:hypothetical protein